MSQIYQMFHWQPTTMSNKTLCLIQIVYTIRWWDMLWMAKLNEYWNINSQNHFSRKVAIILKCKTGGGKNTKQSRKGISMVIKIPNTNIRHNLVIHAPIETTQRWCYHLQVLHASSTCQTWLPTRLDAPSLPMSCQISIYDNYNFSEVL